ncbi:Cytoplasmic tRNA 2-thiolation protein 2 [Actinomortierella ambigua]|uniref:Cytoplasmic tRNA 2-thiolation protein 2 n=1 Tax=Actinomortierella ambigua TaxID=1343610 RepID=A0A9P6UCN5_9FUNG|nr:Cytoplasmic tRNA 2-thiolation protein 2 [Actinomortierella ambigua]
MDNSLAKKGRNTTPGYCFKCKIAKSTIEIRYTEYCNPCFLIYLDHKFRTGLRNSRGANQTPGDNVLIAFSGGPCSRALVHLFEFYKSLPAEINAKNPGQPKTYNEIHVAHIDESCLNTPLSYLENDKETPSTGSGVGAGAGVPATKTTMEKAQAIAAMYGFPFHGVRIEDIYDIEWTESEKSDGVATLLTCLPKEQLAISGQAPELVAQIYASPEERSTPESQSLSREEKVQRLQQLLGALTTLTAKETVLEHIRQRLLTQMTKKARCDVLITGTSATKMAIQILELTALGRGYALPHETALVSTWVDGCKTIRPLKDILQRELELFNALKGLDTIPNNGVDLEPTLQAKSAAKSIGRLTSSFIVGLDKEFPSTAATVCKTAAKLTMPAEATYQNRCPVCAGPVQQGVQTWKSRITVTTPPSSSLSSSSSSSSSSLPAADAGHGQADTGCGSSGICCGSGSRSGALSTRTGEQGRCGSNSGSHTSPAQPNLEFSSLLCYGCLTNLRDLDLKQLNHLSARDDDNDDDDTAAQTHVSSPPAFVLPPFMTETLLNRQGYDSAEAYKAASAAASSTNVRDPREALREQIQEFLINDSDDGSDDDTE